MASNPYEVLGVSKQASQDDIKTAYRKLAKQYHPDLNPGNKSAETRFKEISAAYELIGTAKNRSKYDQGEAEQEELRRHHQQQQQRRGPFYHETQAGDGRYSQPFGSMDEDMFRSIFEQMGGSGNPRGRRSPFEQRGSDVLYKMDISFLDAANGGEREITLPSGKKISVKIPAGVQTGTKLRFAGLGEPGIGEKAPAGDALVELNVLPSPLFHRKEQDIEIELPVSLSEAVLGAEIKVPTIDGSVMLKIPPGVSSGAKLRLTGKGLVNGKTGERGNQYVIIKITMPSHPDADLKQAVLAWSQRQPFDARSGWNGTHGGQQ